MRIRTEPVAQADGTRRESASGVGWQNPAGTWQHESAEQGPVHLLSLDETSTGTVPAQHQVREKEHKISAVKTWLQAFPVWADALHTQRRFCAMLRRFKSHDLLIAKKNQPQMYEDLQLFFEDPEADRSGWQSARSCDKGQGRLEIREIPSSTELTSFFERDWQDLAQVFRLQRTVTRKGETSHELVYGLSSLSPKQADPARLLQLNRAQWQIENRLHWRRDVTLDEEHCQVRMGCAPQALAARKNAVLSLADAVHVPHLAAQMRTFDAHPEQALALLLASHF